MIRIREMDLGIKKKKKKRGENGGKKKNRGRVAAASIDDGGVERKKVVLTSKRVTEIRWVGLVDYSNGVAMCLVESPYMVADGDDDRVTKEKGVVLGMEGGGVRWLNRGNDDDYEKTDMEKYRERERREGSCII